MDQPHIPSCQYLLIGSEILWINCIYIYSSSHYLPFEVQDQTKMIFRMIHINHKTSNNKCSRWFFATWTTHGKSPCPISAITTGIPGGGGHNRHVTIFPGTLPPTQWEPTPPAVPRKSCWLHSGPMPLRLGLLCRAAEKPTSCCAPAFLLSPWGKKQLPKVEVAIMCCGTINH